MTATNQAMYDVREYGAAGDGKTLDTNAINRAVEACHERGGGTVRLTAGTYLTGTVFLRSDVTFRLEAGAVLLGSPDIADYPALPYTSEYRNTALVAAIGAERFAIEGRGTIDGNGDAFALYDRADLLRDFDASHTRQGDGYFRENDKADDGPVEMRTRPGILILILNARDAQVSRVHIRNAPNWCLHVAGTDGALLTGLDIRNSLLVPNADGIDVSRSRNVRISDCNIEAGDDGLAFSPCAEGFGGGGNENIVVQNCTIQSRSAGIRIGWDAHDFRNFLFHNIVIRDSNRGIGLFLREGESIENVVFSNIVIETRLHKGKWWGKAEPIHISALPGLVHAGRVIDRDVKPGRIRGVTFANVTIRGEQGIVLYGSERTPIQDIVFENVRMTMKSGPLMETFGGNFDCRPALDRELNVFAHDIPALYAKHVKGLRIRGFELEWADAMPAYCRSGLEIESFADVTIEGFRGRQPQPDEGAAIVLRDGRGAAVRNSAAAPGTARFLHAERVEGAALYAGNVALEARQAVGPEGHGFATFGNIGGDGEGGSNGTNAG
ncbi:right-handed parallel beta-helix repeat-containing protein [Paenibacillus sp. MWE-103]|uniref:Right-handed parallel beta-helix repeat-containing protein n=1 Tax=Paenibacillus artemisiicola TaxID=1172618 RepID=A0ABS3WKB0_9BACL|nr:glycosyl hydrolase family 28 protein [Paenibacillus artemisiicola]MBO7748526.1 right-handed parallel beta-helix repeat-containing protein [Paenibacillus artemisiicola]